MKRFFTILAVLLSATMAFAQMPQTMSYQGVLHDNADAPYQGNHVLTFSLFDAQTMGTQVWTETHTDEPIADGVFSVVLGAPKNGTAVPLNIAFDKPYFLEITIDGNTLPTRMPLTAVPYALQASQVDAEAAVTKLNHLTGDVTVAGGENVTVEVDEAGKTITVSASGIGTAWTEDAGHLTYEGGHVGIGKNNPGAPLDVSGKIRSSHTEDDTDVIELSHGGANAYVNWTGEGNLDFRRDGNNLMTLDQSGNLSVGGKVGVGKDDPQTQLDVSGTIRSSHTTDEANLIELSHGGLNAFVNWKGEGNLDFRRDNNTLMTLDQSGNVSVNGLTLPTGATDGYVLTTDANGVATWQAAQAGDSHSHDGEGENSFIGGGIENQAQGEKSAVVGGQQSESAGIYAFVGGGITNNASGVASVVLGGEGNTASGALSTVINGTSNTASGVRSTIVGGAVNKANGDHAVVVGGGSNKANGSFSFAAGQSAHAEHDGAIVFQAHGTNTIVEDFLSTGDNQFLISASGGVGIGKNDPQSELDVAGTVTATGLTLPTGATDGYVLTTDANGVATWQAAPTGGASVWAVNGNNTFYNTGDVGVGKNNPQTPLDVSGKIRSSYTEDDTNVIEMAHGGANAFVNWTGEGNLDFRRDGNNLMTLDQSGNLSANGLTLPTGATDGYVLTTDANGVATWQAAQAGGASVWSVNGNNTFYNTGNVGVGKTDPQSELDVAGTVTATGLTLPTGATDGYVLTTDANGVATWQAAPTGGASVWSVNGDKTFYNTGNVGVGKNNPQTPLEVSGTIRSSHVTSGANVIEMGHGGSNAFVNWKGAGNLDFRYNGDLMMSLKKNGHFILGEEHAINGNYIEGAVAIVGGYNNEISASGAATLGGQDNTVSGLMSTVIGGWKNKVTSSTFASILGGETNTVSGWHSVILGGGSNTVSGGASVVLGGTFNTINANYSVVGGKKAEVGSGHAGTFVWADNSGSTFASTGPKQFLIRAQGGVGIGKNNPQTPLDVSGKIRSSYTEDDTNVIELSHDGANAFVNWTGGGNLDFRRDNNNVMTLDQSGNVAITGNVTATGLTLSTGATDGYVLTTDANGVATWQVLPAGNHSHDGVGENSFVGGGTNNQANGNNSFIGGGNDNIVSGQHGVVVGGALNEAGANATVIGGNNNQATGLKSTISGGSGNIASQNLATVGGGNLNTASAFSATVGGGNGNQATGSEATVPGGQSNVASGKASFAAGQQAKANHDGTFVWADNNGGTSADFASTSADQFLIRAGGGVGIGTNSPKTPFALRSPLGTSDVGITQAQLGGSATMELTTADDLGAQATRMMLRGASDQASVEFYSGARGSEVETMRIDPNGVVTANNFQSQSGDFAEYLPRLNADEHIVSGDLVGVFGGKVSRQTAGAERVMVVSDQAVVTGNVPSEDNAHLYETVGFIGQVRTHVRGIVEAGDYIIASGEADGTGVAVHPGDLKAENLPMILGRAWEAKETEEVARVNVSIGLSLGDAQASLFAQMTTEITELRQANLQLQQTVSEMATMKAQMAVMQAMVEKLMANPSSEWRAQAVSTTARVSNAQ